MRPLTIIIICALLLGGCPAKAPVITLPLGSTAYNLGVITQRIEQLCKAKKLTPDDCEYARDVAAKVKAKVDAPPEAGTDWGEVFGTLLSIAGKAAI